MSVYTPVSHVELTRFLAQYPVGELLGYVGIQAGIENSNFFVTTSGGEYVLTLFEQHTPSALGYFLALATHWAAAGIPVPRPLPMHDGEVLGSLAGKPAALLLRLPGTHLAHTELGHCTAIGEVLARMHCAGQSFPLVRPSDRGHGWRMQMAQTLLPQLGGDEAALLRAEMLFQQTIPFAALPQGVIHADLFRDNVLFHDGQPSGVLDVYFACQDSLLYDLAVVVNDWCCHADGTLDEARLAACVRAYQAVRPWTALERQWWRAVLRAAALRFWLSRLHEKLNPRPGELTLQKNPAEFRHKLQQRVDAMCVPEPVTVDARRLLCPLPVIRVQEAVENLLAGVTVTAICTDPGALHDIPAWARIHGHRVLETRTQGRDHIIVLQTGNPT